MLTASGGVTGIFSLAPIQSSGAQFSPVLSYDANDVYLQIDLAKLSPLLASGATRNESNVAGGVDSAIAGGEMPSTAIEDLGNLSSAALTSGADQLAGEIGSDVSQVGQSLFNPFMDTIFDHISDEQANGPVLQSRSRPPQENFWVAGFGGTAIATGQPATLGTHELRSSLEGAALGGNWNISSSFVLGAALSAGTSDFHIPSQLGGGKADAFQGGVYGLMQFLPRLYGSFAGALALDKISTARTVTVSGTDVLTGNFSDYLFGGRYEAGAELGWATPYIALNDTANLTPSYGEKASSGTADFALSYASHAANDPAAEIGLRQRMDFPSDGWTLKLSDRFAWLHDMAGTPDAHPAFTGLPESSFDSYGAGFAKNTFLFSLGADMAYSGGFGFYAHLDTRIAANAQSYTGIGGLNYAW